MNNRIIGIVGSALLILGVFLPIMSLFIITFSLFNFVTGSLPPGGEAELPLMILRILGIIILLIGIGSLLLALKNQLKGLIAMGVVSLACLVFLYIKLQSFFSTAPEQARAMIGVGWGFYVMVLGAIALIVAGVMKGTIPVSGYGAPPPPPPYSPGR